MKKITISLIALTLACPSFANIASDNNNPTCDSTTIGATSGTTNLEAQWTPNIINLKWYNGNDEIALAQNATEKTCSYNSGITLPTTPSAPAGYSFAGWRAVFDLSTLASQISTKGTRYAYIGNNGQSSIANDTGTKTTPDVYSLTESGEWATEFEYGIVKGIARCSTQHPTTFWNDNNYIFTSDHFASSLADQTGQEGARYCWCQPTGFDADKDGIYLNVLPSLWVSARDASDAGGCANSCANSCGSVIRGNDVFRRAVFGVSQ